MMTGALDTPIRFTFFKNFAAQEKNEVRVSLRGIAPRIQAVTKSQKSELPWLKAAMFGDKRTDKNSLRNDANVIAVTGIEADYDGNKIPFDHAIETLEKQGIAALVYTSPSHTEDTPRWRIICPFSEPLEPHRREKMLGRLNGLFGGIFAGESFTLSQAYYYGSVRHNPSHRVQLVDGTPIDQHDDLDEIWIGRPHTETRVNGKGPISGPMDRDALWAELLAGTNYHQATVRLAGHFARNDVPYMEARRMLRDAMESIPEADRDLRWRNRWDDLDRTLEDIFGREARQRDQRPAPEPPPSWLDEPPPSDREPDGMSASEWQRMEARESGQTIPASEEARADAGQTVVWSIVAPWNEADIPVRPWLARGYLMRRSVTVVSGPGSAGKSSLMVAWAAAMAIGSSFGHFKITERLRVATYNVEDDADEQRRRFSAMFRKMGMTTAAMSGYLAILGPERVGTLLTTARDGSLLVNTPVMDRLDAFIAEFRPNVLMLDPFVELHQAEENDNTAVRAVMARFRSMAIERDMSVVLLHHARKGQGVPGDPDSLRGASSIVGAARVALTLNVMTEAEAESFNIPGDDRRNYFRLDGAKNNYAPIESAEWFQREVVILNNGGNGEDPDGVAVAWPWKPRTLLAQTNPGDLNQALDVIAAPGAGWLWSPDRRSTRWAGTPIMETTGCNEGQADAIVKAWLRSGLLYKENFHDEANRKERPGVRVDPSKRPTEGKDRSNFGATSERDRSNDAPGGGGENG